MRPGATLMLALRPQKNELRWISETALLRICASSCCLDEHTRSCVAQVCRGAVGRLSRQRSKKLAQLLKKERNGGGVAACDHAPSHLSGVRSHDPSDPKAVQNFDCED